MGLNFNDEIFTDKRQKPQSDRFKKITEPYLEEHPLKEGSVKNWTKKNALSHSFEHPSGFLVQRTNHLSCFASFHYFFLVLRFSTSPTLIESFGVRLFSFNKKRVF